MDKVYDILLGNTKIGTTGFENADPPMGVILGKISFVNESFDYSFFRDYCVNNDVRFQEDKALKLILTNEILDLHIFDSSGREIKGLAATISGMDDDEFIISVEGIPYPFYEQEFPHHVKAYQQRFKTSTN